MSYEYTLPGRKFLAASISALGLAPMTWLRAQQASPKDEITIGVVGCGNQGCGVMNNFLNIQGARVVAVCDVDAGQKDRAKAHVDNFYKNQDCKSYPHYGDLMQHPGLDAVLIGTPDHMHATVGIAAANAGKHVYGEKPFTWGLREGRLLNDAITKNKVVWQTGSMQRSMGEFRRFRAPIQNNTFGKITRIECGTPGGAQISPNAPEDKWPEMIDKPPSHLDWAGYCGPVKDFPYHPMIHTWNWRWHTSFGGGNLMDWVGHHVDNALWAMGFDRTGPVKVEGSGTLGDHKFFNFYQKCSSKGTFADGRVIEVGTDFTHGAHFGHGVKVTGENGWMFANRGVLEASDREMLRNVPADFDTKPPSHTQDCKEFTFCGRPLKEPMRRPGLPVVLSAVLSAIASGDGGSFSEGGSLLGLRSFSEVGGIDWRAGKWGLRGR
jgi:predicted dehydrogenase